MTITTDSKISEKDHSNAYRIQNIFVNTVYKATKVLRIIHITVKYVLIIIITIIM